MAPTSLSQALPSVVSARPRREEPQRLSSVTLSPRLNVVRYSPVTVMTLVMMRKCSERRTTSAEQDPAVQVQVQGKWNWDPSTTTGTNITMLHAFIEQSGLSTQTNLFEEVVGYLCRLHGTKIKTYHERFNSADTFDGEITPSTFRYTLYTQRDIGMSLKYYTMFLAFNYDAKRFHSLCAVGASFNVTTRDARRVLRMIGDTGMRRRILRACADLGITRDMVSHDAYLDAITQGHGMINGLRESIAKHVNKQLAWVARSHNVHTSDLHTDVTSELLMIYYSMVPTKRTPEHIHSYLCSALHSRIKNLQNKHGSQKRSRRSRPPASGRKAMRSGPPACVTISRAHSSVRVQISLASCSTRPGAG